MWGWRWFGWGWYLSKEVQYKYKPEVIEKITAFKTRLEREACSEIFNSFWEREKHTISSPFINDFNGKKIPTKARSIQMNQELLQHCKKEIQNLLEKRLMRKNKSP